MIKLVDIEKYYKNKFVKTYVLRNIKLEIEQGEFVSIMGPSGAGKSTLLYIIGMLDTPSGGEMFVRRSFPGDIGTFVNRSILMR